jgi:hypothetical protein
MSEQLTPEESAAMTAMAEDTTPIGDVVAVDVPQDDLAKEPAPVAEAVADPDKPPPGFVPQGAMHQERERRKAAEAQLQDFQRKLADIEARLNPPAEIVIPDPILDPKGFKQFQIDQITQRAQERAEAERRQVEAHQQQVVMARLAQDVNAFKVTAPDYDNAFQHAVKARREELAFYGNTPEAIEQQLEVDVQAIVRQAYSQDKNPAEMFYSYAKMRGYSGPAPVAPVTPPEPSQAAAQVTAFANAQKQTATMATAGGPANSGGMTIETLGKMSEADLMKMPKADRDAAMRAVMGG